jgi:hypothetical protein
MISIFCLFTRPFSEKAPHPRTTPTRVVAIEAKDPRTEAFHRAESEKSFFKKTLEMEAGNHKVESEF